MGKIFNPAMWMRDRVLFCRALLYALILTVVFSLLCGALAGGVYLSLTQDTKAPLSLALVDEDGSLFSRLAISLISEHEDMSRLISVQTVTEQQAREGVEDRQFAGAVMLPSGYLDSILTGSSAHGTVVVADGVMRSGQWVRGFARLGERLIQAGQYGVFAGQRAVLAQEDYRDYYNDYLTSMNELLMQEALTGGKAYVSTRELPYGGTSLPLIPHTALLYLLFFLSLSTLFFYRSVTADMSSKRYARLQACGVTPLSFLLPKVTLSFVYRLLCGAALLLLIAQLMPDLSLRVTVGTLASAALALLFLAALGTLLSVTLAGNRYGIAVLSLLDTVALLLCGGVIPLSSLHDGLAYLGTLTPLGAAYGLCAPLFGAAPTLRAYLVALAWVLLLTVPTHARLRRLAQAGEVDA